MVSAAVMEPCWWDWLNWLSTREPWLKEETRGPVAMTVPAASERGITEGMVGKGYLPWGKESVGMDGVVRTVEKREEDGVRAKGMADLGDDQVAVVERGIVPIDKDVVIAQLGDWGGLCEFDILESAFAGDVVLFRGGW